MGVSGIGPEEDTGGVVGAGAGAGFGAGAGVGLGAGLGFGFGEGGCGGMDGTGASSRDDGAEEVQEPVKIKQITRDNNSTLVAI